MRRMISAALAAILFLGGAALAQQQSPGQYGPGPLGSNLSAGSVTTPGSPTARTAASRAADLSVNILDGYSPRDGSTPLSGAKGDGIIASREVTVTSGLSAFTIAGASFASTDVGKPIFIVGAGAAAAGFASTIATVVDATHITTAAPAGTTLNAAVRQVVYGTDDSAAINLIHQAVRADNGITTGTMYAVKVFYPAKVYIVKAASLDFTEFHLAFFDGSGATIYCATNGVGCIDALGAVATTIEGFTVVGNTALPPNTGLQIGHFEDAVAGLNKVENVFLSGAFSLAACYNLGSETTQFSRGTCDTNSANAWGMIVDAIHHFGLTSQWVEVTLSANTLISFSDTYMNTVRMLASGTGGQGLWVAGTKKFACDNCYIRTTDDAAKAINLYSVVGRIGEFSYNGTIEDDPAYLLFFERSGSSAINGVKINLPANLSTLATIGTSAVANKMKIYGLDFQIAGMASSGAVPLFDDVANFEVYGTVTFTSGSEVPVVPTTYTGRLVVTDSATIQYNTQSAQAIKTEITASSGTITQARGAVFLQLEGWGAGGAGGNGINCALDTACTGGGGGGGGGHFKTNEMLWSDLGVTSCSATVGQSLSGGSSSVGGSTTITCGSYAFAVGGGGSGAGGQTGVYAAGGGGGGIAAATSASAGTAGTGGRSGGGNGGSSAASPGTGNNGSNWQGGGGGASHPTNGNGAAGGGTAMGATGGGAGGGCATTTGAPGGGGNAGGNERGTALGGVPGGAGKSTPASGASGGGGGGGDASIGAASVGGAGATPGGGGGGGGSGCDGTGTLAAGGASGGGAVVALQR